MMRAQEILMIVWFVIVMTLDKFVISYYNIILLTISLIVVTAIHFLNKRDRARNAVIVEKPRN